MTKLNQQITLPDGRRLGFDEHGPSDGKPLFYFHGTPSARIEFHIFGDEALLEKLGVRLIAADRPGSGLSDFQPDRCRMDWPRDVISLANHLKLERFAVLGYSGGGLYAAACALAIPQRITKAGIVSGTAPFSEPNLAEKIHKDSRNFMDLSYQKPWLSRMIIRTMGIMSRRAPLAAQGVHGRGVVRGGQGGRVLHVCRYGSHGGEPPLHCIRTSVLQGSPKRHRDSTEASCDEWLGR